MSIGELKEEFRSFCEARDWDQFHGPKDLAIGLMTEAAEVLEKFRFLTEEQMLEAMKNTQFREELGEELADVFAFLLRMSQMWDMDLAKCFAHKMERNGKKYPLEKARGNNLKYTQYP